MAPATVDAYLDALPGHARPHVQAALQAVRRGLPGAEERVRHGMPAVMLDERYALHVGGWKAHLGLYPVSPLPPALEAEVAGHRAAKDALHFRYAEPLPADLIERVAAELRRQRLAA